MIGRVLALAQRTGLRRTLRGGSSTWTAIAIGAFGLRQVQKLARRKPTVVCQDLEPGQSILIVHSRERQR